MNIVAGHFLVGADGRLAALAGIALAARNHRRNDDRAIGAPQSIRAGVDDVAADLVSERQRQLVLGADAVVIIAEIGVADPAAGDFDQDLIAGQGADFEFHRDKRLACAVIIQRIGLALIALPSRLAVTAVARLRAAFNFILQSPTVAVLDQGQGKPKKRILVLKYILEPRARGMGSNQEDHGHGSLAEHLDCGRWQRRRGRADHGGLPARGGQRRRVAWPVHPDPGPANTRR